MPRAQSAIEFMSGYGFVFLIIAIALALLFIFSSIPQTVLPTQCSFLSGFSCTDAIYTNTVHGSALLITAIDTQPGIVNISGFSGYINFAPSYTGVCAPNVAVAGQVVYCTANFTFKPKLGNIYSGSFKIAANYCANGSSNLTTAQCQTSATYTYGGNVRAQSFFFPLSGVWQLPVNVINSQSSGVPPQGQIMIKFTPSTYGTYERSDLGNIRFYSGAKELNSWCETNCTSSLGSNAIFWVKLPQGLPANQNTIINIYFLPTSIEYDGVFAGESPGQSQSYAQYDNGQNVFNFYDNFAGPTLSSNYNVYSAAGDSVSTSNGLSVATVGSCSNAAGIVYKGGFTSPVIFDGYVTSNIVAQSGAAPQGLEEQDGSAGANTGYAVSAWTGSLGYGSLTAGFSASNVGGVNQQTASGIMGIAWVSSNQEVVYKNYVYTAAAGTNENLPSQVYVSAGGYNCAGAFTSTYQWMRVRSYISVMPTTSFGSPAKIG